MFCSFIDLIFFFNPGLHKPSLFSIPLHEIVFVAVVTVPLGGRMQELFRLDQFSHVWVVLGREVAMN